MCRADTSTTLRKNFGPTTPPIRRYYLAIEDTSIIITIINRFYLLKRKIRYYKIRYSNFTDIVYKNHSLQRGATFGDIDDNNDSVLFRNGNSFESHTDIVYRSPPVGPRLSNVPSVFGDRRAWQLYHLHSYISRLQHRISKGVAANSTSKLL